MTATPASRRLQTVGLILIAAAALSGAAGGMHMLAMRRAYGVICGSGGGELAHCAACFAAVALLLSGLAMLAAAEVRRPKRVRSGL